jgi:hypothetical protein
LIVLATTILLLFSSQINAKPVGKVVEQTGPTEIVRNKRSTPSAVNSPVEMNDTIVTAQSKAQLSFEDKTTVKITEQSKLVIDDFVYDPNKGTGKLAMRVALGTARYASGQIAKNNPQQVAVKTPTATIAVRGTDFSMTVDEMGRSLVILLPSCDEKACVTGAIEVSNEAGSVVLDVPYQATYVPSLNARPTTPVVLNIDQNNINNLLIISPPDIVQDDETILASRTALDVNLLDRNYLDENELDKDLLERTKELDINYLDNDYLVNMIDLATQQLMATFEQLAGLNQLLPNYDKVTGLIYYFNEDESKVSLSRVFNHTAIVTVGIEHDVNVNISQDGVNVYQKVNQGGTSFVNIIQK